MTGNEKKELIALFMQPGPIDWKKEMGICKKLDKLNPDIEFWRRVHMGPRLETLGWFFTKDGKKLLQIEEERHKVWLAKKELEKSNETVLNNIR